MPIQSLHIKYSLIIAGGIFALAGWAAFAFYIYVTTSDPNSSIAQYNYKYYAAFPQIIRGYYEMNLAGVISLAISSAAFLILVFGRRRIQILPLIFFALNGALICFMCLIGMTNG